MTLVAIALVAFVAMEGVSYLTHRFVMHGPGMGWHRSHHGPPAGRFERNDLFPVCFSGLGFGLFLVGALAGRATVTAAAVGVTAYGLAYAFVHEVYVHRRLDVRVPSLRYLEWLRESHADHHRNSAEPYGMLLPLRRDRRDGPARTSLARGVRQREERAMRARL